MTVADLIAHLEQCDPAAIVRFAYQPNYPLWGLVGGVAETEGGEVYVLEDQRASGGYATDELWELSR